MNNFETDFFAFDLFQRPEERFERALRIAFQHDAQNFLASRRFKQSFQRCSLGNEELACTFRLEAFIAQLFRSALGFHDKEFVTGIWQAGKPKHFHRGGRSGLFDRLAAIVQKRFYLAAVITTDEWVTDF